MRPSAPLLTCPSRLLITVDILDFLTSSPHPGDRPICIRLIGSSGLGSLACGPAGKRPWPGVHLIAEHPTAQWTAQQLVDAFSWKGQKSAVCIAMMKTWQRKVE